ncbi:MAG: 7,8-didemethyl-8-hydroxy-5-deazariboflavin synthase subunit CofH [Betaproteobacteria bacterium]|nr:7,8-didemethyl-8-hydroxy-5-deazariboflavin synthase subunit CofH [Betaproteobacteria bacterium]
MHTTAELFDIGAQWPLPRLLAEAARLRDAGHGDLVSYSRKVFIPLTHLCRDVCHYCTFATTPRDGARAYLSPDEVLAIARAGRNAGCHEALFTLGDKPELRYKVARDELKALGYATTIEYLAAMCALVLKETGLLPHANPGVLSRDELALLRKVNVSQGVMLESSSVRLCERGGPHFGSPDKFPAVRLATIEEAGRLAIPFTSGILIGIGETRAERIEALLALRELNERFGHLQEVIVQNFRAKPATLMAGAPDADRDELLWTIAMARLTLGAQMSVQAPPNLSPDDMPALIAAGINDWGGVSPVTPDHVNPEAPWPAVEKLRAATASAGKILVERLTSYPRYCLVAERWHDAQLVPHVLRNMDGSGFARVETWTPGRDVTPPALVSGMQRPPGDRSLQRIIDQAMAADLLAEHEIVQLFSARDDQVARVCEAADTLRARSVGDTVRYVVNRNINYTNVCYYKCRFCAFSKGRHSADLRGAPYDLALDEIQRRVTEAWARGATEVCMQGGIHPDYTGATYLSILRAVKEAVPGMHVHAFSPLEVSQGAATLGIPVANFLEQLQKAGLGSLPGTAAEILDDEVRKDLCPDKLRTDEWLAVMKTAHTVGLRSTATIMFGHIDRYEHWARHLMRVRDLQIASRGFTEFVPLPFIHMEAPMYLRGKARTGPTYREALLMHAVSRLALFPHIQNIQTSWVKMGSLGAGACLAAGANDLGGTLMNESISRAAGNEHGQELAPAAMDALIRASGRQPAQRSTLYGSPNAAQLARSYHADPLLPVVQTPVKRRMRAASGTA